MKIGKEPRFVIPLTVHQTNTSKPVTLHDRSLLQQKYIQGKKTAVNCDVSHGSPPKNPYFYKESFTERKTFSVLSSTLSRAGIFQEGDKLVKVGFLVLWDQMPLEIQRNLQTQKTAFSWEKNKMEYGDTLF